MALWSKKSIKHNVQLCASFDVLLIIQGIDFSKMTRDVMADFVDRGFLPGNPFDEFIEAQWHLDDYAVRDKETDDGNCFTEEDFRAICEECQDSLYSHEYGSC